MFVLISLNSVIIYLGANVSVWSHANLHTVLSTTVFKYTFCSPLMLQLFFQKSYQIYMANLINLGCLSNYINILLLFLEAKTILPKGKMTYRQLYTKFTRKWNINMPLYNLEKKIRLKAIEIINYEHKLQFGVVGIPHFSMILLKMLSDI